MHAGGDQLAVLLADFSEMQMAAIVVVNFAVEQERAIRESELDTEIAVELKKRSIRETQMDAEASVVAKKNELREAGMVADITLEGKRKDFVALNAENTRTLADAEAYRVGALMKIFEGVDTKVIQARIARTASGCSSVATVPALSASKRSPPSERRSPSAICDRAAL